VFKTARGYYHVMIFVLSFAAVVFLVQKFDFRKCMFKSDNHINDLQDNKDCDDDSNKYNGAILAQVSTDSDETK
jgi:hypothetical protein